MPEHWTRRPESLRSCMGQNSAAVSMAAGSVMRVTVWVRRWRPVVCGRQGRGLPFYLAGDRMTGVAV